MDLQLSDSQITGGGGVSGVPQGSVLGPLLFKMYINGITDLKLTTSCKLVLYADDIIVYKPIYKETRGLY